MYFWCACLSEVVFLFFVFSGVTPNCCVIATKKFPLDLLMKVTKYDVQTTHGVCTINALVWVIDDMSYWMMGFWRMIVFMVVVFLLSDSTPTKRDTARRPESSDSCRTYWSWSRAWKTSLLFEHTRSRQTAVSLLFQKTSTRCFCLHVFLRLQIHSSSFCIFYTFHLKLFFLIIHLFCIMFVVLYRKAQIKIVALRMKSFLCLCTLVELRSCWFDGWTPVFLFVLINYF